MSLWASCDSITRFPRAKRSDDLLEVDLSLSDICRLSRTHTKGGTTNTFGPIQPNLTQFNLLLLLDAVGGNHRGIYSEVIKNFEIEQTAY